MTRVQSSHARPSVVIVSGCPGTGKTTLARALASALSPSAHVRLDDFFAFLAVPIVPSLPEASAQNETVMRALARAAVGFVDGGYEVILDGVIGPWYLDLFRRELGTEASLHFVVLRAEVFETVRRGTSRAEPVHETVIRSMHPQFADLGPLERHAVDTSKKTNDVVLREVLRDLRAHQFVLR